MATIKAYTDIPQSEKLAEILPLDSADMCYLTDITFSGKCRLLPKDDFACVDSLSNLPCWSLAALLNLLKGYTLQTNTDGTVFVVCESKKPMISNAYGNPVDACYEMIIKLKERNLI